MSLAQNMHLRLFVGAALISLSPVWVRLVDVSPTTSGFYRVFFGGAALAIYVLVTRRSLRLGRRVWSILIAAAVFFSLDLWFWHRSILYIGPGLSTLLANFQVFIMMFAGIVFLKQKPHLAQLVAVPLAVLGLALIVGLDWSTLPQDYRTGVVLGLLTACAYAGYMLSLRASRRDATDRLPTREVLIVSLLTAAALGLSAMAEGQSLALNATDFGWLLGYGVLSHCIGWLLIASSLPHVSTTEAGLALLLQPTLSFFWDVLIFDRGMTGQEFLGAAIALFAIFLGARAPSKQNQR
ncbi:MAG: DMT family transporter [Woeseiaceae bacterium]|nr:DMT family transporter [Woeseiaceae bacterium]